MPLEFEDWLAQDKLFKFGYIQFYVLVSEYVLWYTHKKYEIYIWIDKKVHKVIFSIILIFRIVKLLS